MRISFDLDGTLFVRELPSPPADPKEGSICEGEKVAGLRIGTRNLLNTLALAGWDIWIYTSSYRGKSDILNLFSQLVLPLSGVINRQIHEGMCVELGTDPLSVPNKMPPWFGIDLHVDDSPAVAEEGRTHGFRVCLVGASDPCWVDHVLSSAFLLSHTHSE